ncbi:MAG: ABC transporter ATP-binding protein [Crenarchaeota archaeon]|nr:ABC transporter ATP-binding protein [Thermoproteota archaeon]
MRSSPELATSASLRYVDVWKYYSGKPVLKGVSTEFSPGRVAVLLGPNGSGKSTLMKMSIALVRPDRGYVSIGDRRVDEDPIWARKVVGYVPEDPVLYESLEIVEYLSFVSSIYGIDVPQSRVDAVIRALRLEEHLGKFIGELSHGTKKKVAIASVMLRDPPVLVLDEVFSGLDVESARVVKLWIREKASRGGVVVVSTHILPLAEAVADRVVIIHEGSIKADAPPTKLRELGEELEEVYLKLTGYSAEIEELVRALRG